MTTPANTKDAKQMIVDWLRAKPSTRRVLVRDDGVKLQTLVSGQWLEAIFATPQMAAAALLSRDFKWRAAPSDRGIST